MKASLKNYRQSPRKVRLVTDLIKGMSVKNALTQLSFLPKKAAEPISKLLKSALVNAKQTGEADEGNMYVKNITVDDGVTLKRSMPRAFGRASRINRRSSHVNVALEQRKSEIRSSKPEGKKVKNTV